MGHDVGDLHGHVLCAGKQPGIGRWAPAGRLPVGRAESAHVAVGTDAGLGGSKTTPGSNHLAHSCVIAMADSVKEVSGMSGENEAAPLEDAQAALSRLAAAGAPLSRVASEVGTLVAAWASEPEMDVSTA